jgi:(p)ppGpp synthase/HD superfamily hydrolase
MTAQMTSADAKAFARLQHVGQLDKAGEPYLAHLERVTFAAERRAQQAQVAGLALQVDQVTQAAWLHHVVGDTSVTPEELRTTGFAEPVVAMVELLTKPNGQASEEECTARLVQSGNLGAILIQLSDNEETASADCLLHPENPPPAHYAASMARLRKAAAALGYTGL